MTGKATLCRVRGFQPLGGARVGRQKLEASTPKSHVRIHWLSIFALLCQAFLAQFCVVGHVCHGMVRHHEAQMLVRDFMRRSEPEDEGDPEEWSEDSIFDFHSDEGGNQFCRPWRS